MGAAVLVHLACALGAPGVTRRVLGQTFLQALTVPDVGSPAVTFTKSCTPAETNRKDVSHIGAVPREKVNGKELGPISKELTVAGKGALRLREALREQSQDQTFGEWYDGLNDQNRIAYGAAVGVNVGAWTMAGGRIFELSNGKDVTPAAGDVQARTRKGRENQQGNVAGGPAAKKQGKAGAKPRGVTSTGANKGDRKSEKAPAETIAALKKQLKKEKKKLKKEKQKWKCYEKEQKEANTDTQGAMQQKITKLEKRNKYLESKSETWDIKNGVDGEKGKRIGGTDSVTPN